MFIRAVAATLLFLGLLMAGFGVYFIALGYEAEGWAEVEGRVVSADVRVDVSIPNYDQTTRTQGQAVRRYYPSITYEWTLRGETFSGSRYRLGETHEKYAERAEAEAAAARFQPGAPIPVYYDVDHPDQAVLDPSLSVGVFVPLPLGLLFALSGWLLFRYREAFDKAMAPKTTGQTGG